MFRVTEHRAADRFILKLEGRCSSDVISELDAGFRAALSKAGNSAIWIDLSDVSRVDTAGLEQLTRMHRAGARFVARGCFMRELIREICDLVD